MEKDWRAAVVLCLVTLAVHAASAQVDADPVVDATPGNIGFMVLRNEVGNALMHASECLQKELTGCAQRELLRASGMRNLTAQESSQISLLYGKVMTRVADPIAAIAAYETVLELPRNEVPGSSVRNSMRSLADLYAGQANAQRALAMLDAWFVQPNIYLKPEDHFLRASLLHALGDDFAALGPLAQAIEMSNGPQEPHYQLLYEMRDAAGDRPGALAALELLVARWPNEQRTSELARLKSGAETLPAPVDNQ